MKTLAIITARGGSKRIPRKNIRPFCGKPILAYSIQAALDSNCFDSVMCSTDDQEIAEVARRYGAEVPFMRSAENSSDFATTGDVLTEVIQKYQEQKRSFDAFCCIYPTAPFLTAAKIREGFEKVCRDDSNGAMSVVQFSYPIQRALKIESGKVSMLDPENFQTRTQDLVKTYHDAGQFYWVKTPVFLQNPKMLQLQLSPVILSDLEVQDIDTEEDWKIAEMKYQITRL